VQSEEERPPRTVLKVFSAAVGCSSICRTCFLDDCPLLGSMFRTVSGRHVGLPGIVVDSWRSS